MVEIMQYKLGEKTYNLLKQSKLQANVGDWCTEILLEVLQLLLGWLMEVVKVRENEVARLIDELLACFDMCVQLLNNGQAANESQQVVVDRASQCLILMLQLYATCQNQQTRKREIYFTESHLNCLINALKCQQFTSAQQGIPQVQQFTQQQ